MSETSGQLITKLEKQYLQELGSGGLDSLSALNAGV
jgi:hypothetical protein